LQIKSNDNEVYYLKIINEKGEMIFSDFVLSKNRLIEISGLLPGHYDIQYSTQNKFFKETIKIQSR